MLKDLRYEAVDFENCFPLGRRDILCWAEDQGLGLTHRVEPSEHETEAAAQQENIQHLHRVFLHILHNSFSQFVLTLFNWINSVFVATLQLQITNS